jgi:hypothetical protein
LNEMEEEEEGVLKPKKKHQNQRQINKKGKN